ncbi:hypothetical protein OF83DRAFT_1283338 [Amylostereum chailletii]|nr:hypothetical protein OF83DRAFT_1283338 [Amylostereum chailletii]
MVSATPAANGRSIHARAILGPELHDRLPSTKVLLVGAGGIGCELLKNIVLAGFGKITLLDLDTIDLSNLNRQFLFKKKDVKQSKAMVAARTASAFNPNVHINPIHGNIKDPQFDLAWFKSFDIVLNALDNLDARRHVNKMCMAGNVPLVESGTAGYLGQVQPLLKDRTECFDCIPKQTPKTFPVCTIRSTPSQPIHCIVWAKSYLMSQLFGEDEDSAGELDDALKQGENAQEIDTLRKEAQAFKAVREALRSTGQSEDAAKLAFQKVFNADVRNLLSMEDMWRFRDKPIPLDFDAIKDDQFTLRGVVASAAAITANGASNGKTANGSSSSSASTSNGKLKDQRALSLRDNWDMFVQSTGKLAARLSAGEETISFDKDDDDTLDFVTAAANLRSAAYGIPGKTRWEVKEMAGNIIPAIATTNAIISGLIVLQALHVLRGAHDKLRNVHIQFKPAVPLSAIALSTPSLTCGVCRDAYGLLQCDPARTKLGEVVDAVAGDGRDVSTYEGQRLLSDPDFDDNLERSLESLNVTRGMFLNVVDDEGEYEAISLAIAPLPPNHPVDGPSMILPSPLPHPAKKPPKPKPVPETPPRVSLKRSAPDDDEVELAEGPAKRLKTSGPGSPNKRRKLEADGLVMLEKQDEEMEDDIIVLD